MIKPNNKVHNKKQGDQLRPDITGLKLLEELTLFKSENYA
jgi:hypothetical protein